MTTKTAVQIESGDLSLEGALYEPEAATRALVVVCHPHPQRGGEMRNNVVMIVVRALNELGVAALTFNFRGVGASEGVFDNGGGEQEDVRAALAHGRSIDGVERVGLAGYSFGAGMAAATVDDSVAALALVSGPAATLGRDSLVEYKGPVLLVSGDQDQISSADGLREAAARRTGPVQVVSVAGADHFWRGHEQELTDAVTSFFAPVFAKTPS